jgi:hypothetical protein
VKGTPGSSGFIAGRGEGFNPNELQQTEPWRKWRKGEFAKGRAVGQSDYYSMALKDILSPIAAEVARLGGTFRRFVIERWAVGVDAECNDTGRLRRKFGTVQQLQIRPL